MRKYYYGITKKLDGSLGIFAHRKMNKIPNDTIEVMNRKVESRDEALEAAHEILLNYRESTSGLMPGDIVIYADNYGQHTAIVLHCMDHQSYFVFVTSNPNWGRMAREISKEEQSLMGYPDKGRTSYFSPVIRDNDLAVTTGKIYPMHRVEELIKEFDDGFQ